MRDMLSTFQKHIGKHHIDAAFEVGSRIHTPSGIHKFSEDIKGANEFIGALQSASVVLKKILKVAQSVNTQGLHSVRSHIENIIANASFMGVALFDTQLDMHFNAKTYTFSIDNPLSLCPNVDSADSMESTCEVDMSAFIGYVEEKGIEIAQILIEVSEAISEPSSEQYEQEQYSFDTFNPAQFTQMFKGR